MLEFIRRFSLHIPPFGTGAHPPLWNPRQQSQKMCYRSSPRDLQAPRTRRGTSAAERCGSALWRNVLSVVWKSRNSSGGLYRCRRRSAHYRRRTNAMRFLLKTLLARPVPRLIHAFPQNPLWIRSGCAAVFVSYAKPGWGHLGDWRSTNRAHGPFGKSSILLLKAAATAIRASQIPRRRSLHPIAHATFPIR